MIRARRAAVRLARIAGLAVSDVAGALGVSDQTVRRLAGRSPDWTLVNAAATRLALEDELRRVTLGVPRYSR
jgi:transposase-like protein